MKTLYFLDTYARHDDRLDHRAFGFHKGKSIIQRQAFSMIPGFSILAPFAGHRAHYKTITSKDTDCNAARVFSYCDTDSGRRNQLSKCNPISTQNKANPMGSNDSTQEE